jgi:hypothetical protein
VFVRQCAGKQEDGLAVRSEKPKATLRCAVYTRVSTEHGLEQEFNSLDNQREASEAYIKSQAHEGWRLIRTRYDDGGYSGGSMERPALQKLLDEVRARRVDVVVVYKVDRLTRSLADFAKLVEVLAYRLQSDAFGDRDKSIRRILRSGKEDARNAASPHAARRRGGRKGSDARLGPTPDFSGQRRPERSSTRALAQAPTRAGDWILQ